MENIRLQTRRLAVLGLMLALIMALSALEHMLPPLPFLPPQVRLGLSNVVTMYALFFLGFGPAVTLVVLKSLSVFLMRGAVASALSLCGGLLSLLVIVVFRTLLRQHISWLLLSVLGAIAHNMGQILVARTLLGTTVLVYLPVLVLSGVLMGSITGTLLRTVFPVFEKTLHRGYSGRKE